MSFSYGWEKLHSAVHSLCGANSQSERLINAASFSLLNIKAERHLPEELRVNFTTLMSDLTSKKASGDEGTIRATINSFNESELNGAIESIISLYDSVCRHQEPN